MTASAGAVLAGGRASRLPGKPLVELAGRPLIARPIAALREAGLEPVIVAKAAQTGLREYAAAERVRFVEEPAEPVHAVFGIVSALELIAEPVVVAAADMPFVPAAFLRHLAGQAPVAGGATVVEVGGRLEPLLGCYDPGAVEHLRAAVELGAPAQQALRSLGPLLTLIGERALLVYGEPEMIVRDVDDDAALEGAEESFRRSAGNH